MKFPQLLLYVSGIVLLFNTCEKDSPSNPSGKESKVYDVTYTENTIFIDSLAAESIVSIDAGNHIYYFENSDPSITDLDVDDILLIHGKALRRVTNISQQGDETKVETAYAALNEAISDGEISWNKEISFKDGVVPEITMGGKNIPFKSSNADGFEFEFTYGEYDYRIKFDFSEEKADVEFEISKELVNPITARFLATGSINNFHSSTTMKFEDSELTEFGHKNANMQGEMVLNLTVAGSGRDVVTFDFPVVLLKYPVMVGPIPVIINLKVLFVVNCVVPVDGSSQVEARFSYNSTTGIKYDGASVSADASMGDQDMNKNIAQTGASSAIAANFGLAFPRLELGIFDEVIVPYIQTAFLIGGDYTFTPACQQARAQFIGACGIDLSFLGFSYSASKTLWQEEKVLLRAGDCE